jgi:excisionase family DNA binding protein
MTIATSIPSEKDAALARDSSYILSQAQTDSLTLSIKQSDGSERHLQLPSIAIAALNEILTAIGQGQSIEIVTLVGAASPVENRQLTIQAAADLLNVSRSYLVNLLETDQIPFILLEGHQSIRYEDVIAYREQIDTARRKVLDELTAEAQILNLGYE